MEHLLKNNKEILNISIEYVIKPYVLYKLNRITMSELQKEHTKFDGKLLVFWFTNSHKLNSFIDAKCIENYIAFYNELIKQIDIVIRSYYFSNLQNKLDTLYTDFFIT